MGSCASHAGFGVTLFAIMGSAAYTSRQMIASTRPELQLPDEARRRRTFDENAERVDWKIGFDEFIIGINRWRRHLVRKAEGVVLETAAGTCRNFSYFTAHKVKSITVTDFSRPMLQRCLQKISAFVLYAVECIHA
eukprot:Platyproteum_vivax@DN14580_c0_g1_i1.p1